MASSLSICALCGSEDSISVYTGDGFVIRRCDKCRLAATVPPEYVTRSEYDNAPEMAVKYAAAESKTREYVQPLLRVVRKQVAAGRLLDIGCSVGILVDEACKLGYTAEGIDLDSNAVRYGKQQGRTVYRTSLEEWTTSGYDVICLSHTLEHIPQPLEFLTTCKAYLRPGGCLAVMVPCYTGLHPRLFRQRWYGWMPSQHYYHYAPQSLARLFHSVGLETLDVTQNSMDHRINSGALSNAKEAVKTIGSYGAALLGGVIGQGDQLIGVARLPDSSVKG